jgi:putative transcriptional regulator
MRYLQIWRMCAYANRRSPSSELRNANTIRQLRFHHGEMTQKELAKFVGVSRQTICAIERGKYSPSLEVAFRTANILCTSIEDVFYYEPDIEGTQAQVVATVT